MANHSAKQLIAPGIDTIGRTKLQEITEHGADQFGDVGVLQQKLECAAPSGFQGPARASSTPRAKTRFDTRPHSRPELR